MDPVPNVSSLKDSEAQSWLCQGLPRACRKVEDRFPNAETVAWHEYRSAKKGGYGTICHVLAGTGVWQEGEGSQLTSPTSSLPLHP